LHFEVRCNNVPMNPKKYLGKMGLMAEVKFRRHRRSLASARILPRRRTKKPNFQQKVVKRDASYYTRMINLRKLHNMKMKQKSTR
ncbi:MAG: hypothetical protein AAF203_04980, partial [Pseudomonadota bacterium]